jgi:hypothetical protein
MEPAHQDQELDQPLNQSATPPPLNQSATPPPLTGGVAMLTQEGVVA